MLNGPQPELFVRNLKSVLEALKNDILRSDLTDYFGQHIWGGLVFGSNSVMRYVSLDQKISPVTALRPKLPVWLNFCASDR